MKHGGPRTHFHSSMSLGPRRGLWLILGEMARNSRHGKDGTGLELKSNRRRCPRRCQRQSEKGDSASRRPGLWVSGPVYATEVHRMCRPPTTTMDEAPLWAGGALGAHWGPQHWEPGSGPDAASPLSTLTTYAEWCEWHSMDGVKCVSPGGDDSEAVSS